MIVRMLTALVAALLLTASWALFDRVFGHSTDLTLILFAAFGGAILGITFTPIFENRRT